MAKAETPPMTSEETKDVVHTGVMPKGVDAVFVAPAEKCRIGNFIPEIKTGGHIDRHEEEIRFEGHIFLAKGRRNPDGLTQAEFIRKSRGFGSDCFEVKSLKEAHQYIAGWAAKKKEVTGRIIETEAAEEQDF